MAIRFTNTEVNVFLAADLEHLQTEKQNTGWSSILEEFIFVNLKI